MPCADLRGGVEVSEPRHEPRYGILSDASVLVDIIVAPFALLMFSPVIVLMWSMVIAGGMAAGYYS